MNWLKNDRLKWYHKLCIKVLKVGPIPKHIAFIMDGNRRFAKKEQIQTTQGHSKGFDKLKEVIFWCIQLDISEMTVYAFSIENFHRSKEEVDDLLKLATNKFKELQKDRNILEYYGISIRFIGDLSLISHDLRIEMAKVVSLTRNNNKIIVNIAFAYTSQNEIVNGMQMINNGIQSGKIMLDDINEGLLHKCLHCPSKVDLLIRTSGEVRFSDFLLWQSWSANVIFLQALWPGLTIWHLAICILNYQRHYQSQQMIEQQLQYGSEEDVSDYAQQFLKSIQQQREKELEIYCDNS